MTTLRPAERRDLAAIDAIYNHYILETPITFDLEPPTEASQREWFELFSDRGRHRLLVAECEGRVAGMAWSHSFRAKAAYGTTVETSVYLDVKMTGRGLGTKLYAALFEALEGEDLHRALAGITLPNPASVALHRRFGFRSTGVLSDVGRKFDRYWDVEWFEKPLGLESRG